VVLAAIAIVLCIVGIVSLIVWDGVGALLSWGAPIAAFGWLCYAVYIQPSVRMTEGFIDIRNIFRSHRVPWGDVDSVDSRYALTVHPVDGRHIRAWAAPAPAARRALGMRRVEVAGTPGEGDVRRPSDAVGTDSGDATALATAALARYRRDGGPALPGGTVTTWHLWTIAVTAVLVAAALAGLTQAAAHG
jgi:hypothetical protein